MKKLLLAIYFLLPIKVLASYPHIYLDELLEEESTIYKAQITSAKASYIDGIRECKIKFTAKILKNIKGSATVKNITFYGEDNYDIHLVIFIFFTESKLKNMKSIGPKITYEGKPSCMQPKENILTIPWYQVLKVPAGKVIQLNLGLTVPSVIPVTEIKIREVLKDGEPSRVWDNMDFVSGITKNYIYKDDFEEYIKGKLLSGKNK